MKMPTVKPGADFDDDAPTVYFTDFDDDDDAPTVFFSEDDDDAQTIATVVPEMAMRKVPAPVQDGERLRVLLSRSPMGVGLPETVRLVSQALECLGKIAPRLRLLSLDSIMVDRKGRMGFFVGEVSDAYRPPELRNPGQAVDEPAVVFSLGVVFHELMTGVKPYRVQAEMPLELRWAEGSKPIKLYTRFRDRFNGVNRLLQRALAQDPGLRFQTLVDFRHALVRYQDFGI